MELLMRSYQVISGKPDQIPAIGTQGIGEPINKNLILFYPFDLNQLPCPLNEFEGFLMSQSEMKELPSQGDIQ